MIRDSLPSYFQERSSVLIGPTQPININTKEVQNIIHLAQSPSKEENKSFIEFFLENKIYFS